MNPGLLDQAIDLMLYGIGVVFVFLGVLVAAASLMSWLVRRFGPPPSSSETDGGDDDAAQQAAASAAAAHHHRDRPS